MLSIINENVNINDLCSGNNSKTTICFNEIEYKYRDILDKIFP